MHFLFTVELMGSSSSVLYATSRSPAAFILFYLIPIPLLVAGQTAIAYVFLSFYTDQPSG
jgi:hypothetical protein